MVTAFRARLFEILWSISTLGFVVSTFYARLFNRTIRELASEISYFSLLCAVAELGRRFRRIADHKSDASREGE